MYYTGCYGLWAKTEISQTFFTVITEKNALFLVLFYKIHSPKIDFSFILTSKFIDLTQKLTEAMRKKRF